MIRKLSRLPRRRCCAGLLLLPLLGPAGCGAPPAATAASARDVGLPGTSGLVPDPATPPPPTDVATVAVRPFREPNDHAHRNYCGAGATEVLLSAWRDQVPDVEVVARTAGLDPRSGETGAQAPSPVAGHTGPPSRTISLAALWLAMRQFITDAPGDPVNLIR